MFLFLSLAVEHRVTLLPERQVVLAPRVTDAVGKDDRPFRLSFPDGGGWSVGDGRYLHAQTMRLIGLRKQIGYRYRNRNGTGHGRAKITRSVRLRVQQLGNVRDEFRRRLVNDIVRQCERQQAGTLVYREPSGPAKTKCWFERRKLEFDWTRFLTDLKNSAARHGIAVEKKRLKMEEVKKDEAEACATV